MDEGYRIVIRLTEENLPTPERRRMLKEFARLNGWRPSDLMEEHPATLEFANGHLIVEHGLNNSAVITFLKPHVRYEGLSHNERLQLLSLSYNNLVDWHVFPDASGAKCVYNRTDPPTEFYIDHGVSTNCWHADAFERIVGRRPNPNLRALDDALIETVKHWKLCLAADLGRDIGNDNLAVLFNNLFMVRALEDCRRRGAGGQRLLLAVLGTLDPQAASPERIFTECLRQCGIAEAPASIRADYAKLQVFRNLDVGTLSQLFRDFYRQRGGPYEYDFSIITKHALSRIYETYVALLREKSTPQMALFRDLPEVVANRELGGVYTPQFIARFFARYLRNNLTPPSFRSLRAIDPACGSGIFLRTLLEMQCDPQQEIDVPEVTRTAFNNMFAIDVDPNACQAARLSLHLLHLVLVGAFADKLNVIDAEAIEYFNEHRELRGTFDAVLANPPFIKWDHLSSPLRNHLRQFLKEHSIGKIDLFLAFLQIGLEMLRPGGFGLFVLPRSFLLADNAATIRKAIADGSWVRVLADLSEIPVFEGVGSYVILLIVQKHPLHPIAELSDRDIAQPLATLVRCRDQLGAALQAAVDGRPAKGANYEVFHVSQSFFNSEHWTVLPEAQTALVTRLQQHPMLGDLVDVKQGFVTGADSVFIRPASDVPSGERTVWADYLSDREMEPYATPRKAKHVVFYPFKGTRKLTQTELRKDFPATWRYLSNCSEKLRSRRFAQSGEDKWWQPERPRSPKDMLRPKVVAPHLMLTPKFSLDEMGQWTVSHAPYLISDAGETGIELLLYLLAILNSPMGYWQITHLSDRYSRGYAMLEPKTLRRLRVPDPSRIPSDVFVRIQSLTRDLIMRKRAADTERALHGAILDLYKLTDAERAAVVSQV